MSILEKGTVNKYLSLLNSRTSYICLLKPLIEPDHSVKSKTDNEPEPEPGPGPGPGEAQSRNWKFCSTCNIHLGPHIYESVIFYINKKKDAVTETCNNYEIGFSLPRSEATFYMFPEDTIGKLFYIDSKPNAILSFSVPYGDSGKYLALTMRVDGLSAELASILASTATDPKAKLARQQRKDHIIQQDRVLFWEDFDMIRGSAEDLKLVE